MKYNVFVHETEGTILGLTTIDGTSPPPGFISVRINGDLPPDLTWWNKDAMNFTPPVPNEKIVTKLQFLTLFTTEERIAIRNSVDPIVVDFMEMLQMAENIDLYNSTTQQGIGYLSMIGLIAPERVSEIIGV